MECWWVLSSLTGGKDGSILKNGSSQFEEGCFGLDSANHQSAFIKGWIPLPWTPNSAAGQPENNITLLSHNRFGAVSNSSLMQKIKRSASTQQNSY